MSANYTCNQFDAAYKPTRLGNWEVPKWHLNRPKGRSTVTKVIANDQGHLLPGVHKTDQKHWAGLYLGTYQLPKRITKEIAMELSNPKCQTWMKRSYHHPFISGHNQKDGDGDKSEKTVQQPDACREQRTKIDGQTDGETDRESIKSVKSAISNEPADVSTFGAARKCGSADNVAGGQDGRRGSGGVSSVRKTPSSPALSRISATGSGGGGGGDGGGSGDNAETAPAAETEETGRPAGRWHEDAHKHHRLPDAIEDAVYRSLQTKRHRHPGLGLDGCWPKCSAVAYKSFNDPGPTQCSKLRVYRPKTSSSAVPDGSGGGERKEPPGPDGRSPRPKTCPTVAQPQHRLTDIKLALCWDLDAPFDRNRPAAGPDEPAVFHKIRRRRSSGGGDNDDRKLSQPPQNSSAVMGFVRGDDGNKNCGRDDSVPKNRNLSAVMELIPNKDDSPRAGDPDDDDGHNKSGGADVCRDDDGRDDGNEGPPQAADRRGRREPDAVAGPDEPGARGPDRISRRPCAACDGPGAGRDREPAREGHYKMAFKAGVPAADDKRVAADRKPDGRRHHHHHRRRGHLKVPKPRTTNSDDKKYVIGTLLPPFSMWPGTTARDYPEHWRLTSVYRQAFKPLELRKQPLLRTVYL